MTPATPALHALLDQSLRYPPEFGQQLSSHLPMALAALEGLGADGARLQAFFNSYTRRFAPLATTPQVPAEGDAAAARDWPALRGRFEAFDALRAHFGQALLREGRDAVLRGVLPWLLPGAGTAAFHGAIRTAHAVDSGHAAELATALAYWTARWSMLPPPDTSTGDGDPIDGVADWLDALDAKRRQHDANWQPAGASISGRMQAAARTVAYRSMAGRLRTAGRDPAALLQDLAHAAGGRYARSGNFTVLHMTTGARAARVLAPWLPDDPAALQPLWHAVAAASLASNLAPVAAGPAAPATDGVPPADWDTVRAQAIASDDDHVIKLVHAAAELHAAAPDPVWLRAAARAVRA